MNVKLIRMWSGEDVVADLTNEDENSITIVNPIVGVPSSQSTLAFAPWSPILKGRGTELTSHDRTWSTLQRLKTVSWINTKRCSLLSQLLTRKN